MLDHHLFAQQADTVFAQLRRRGVAEATLATITDVLTRRRETITRTEALRSQLNAATAEIQVAVRAKQTDIIAQNKDRLRALKQAIKDAEVALGHDQAAFDTLMLSLPNLPHADVPDGLDENDNREERQVGTIPSFSFTPRDHTTLGESLELLDFGRASNMSGARFVVMRGIGARLERALINFMLDMAREHGYEEMGVPLLVKPESMQAAGPYPKFKGESFETQDSALVLIPTAEVPLVNLHQGEVIEAAALPLRYTAYTPCFRREAGSAGRDTRGLIRLHQFNKVEMVAFTTPETSHLEHERLTGHAEAILQRLGLAYRVVTLCTGDLGFAAQKTYDIEVWLPGSNKYREISSCSNCGDFQARRGQMRYRTPEGKLQPMHTLNGSGIAVGRALVAVLENYQQEDGSIRVPDALVPYLGGLKSIDKNWRSERDSNPR
jgi:seryl-tRNA synthetase